MRGRGGAPSTVALGRALEIIRGHHGDLAKADVVLVTDGGSHPTSAPDLRAQAAQLGVTTLGLAIDVDPSYLAPWCDEVHTAPNLSTVDEAIATDFFSA